ncbi:MAG: COX15/CtaA family protein [Burkholderiales bacterium]|nr:COX15/CtaA family protein [Burkholderiales bacterium]
MDATVAFGSPALARDLREAGSRRAVAAWLLACCALVFAMVVVGGVTRLTHSGLSIVEWQPIVGTLPPLDEAQWQDAFGKYKLTPEYRLVNRGMSLDEFKGIFWWEYFHRLLGRLIGAAFLLPFLVFLVRRRIPGGYGLKLAGIFVLGGLQGALGWYMVQSGLVDDPRVSPFRLTAHLGLAILIFGAMLWVAMSLLFAPGPPRDDPAARSARRWATGTAVLVFAMILTGGFVAGIRAGFAYNTFPLMNGSVVPPEILMIEPWWRNFFWNMATVQFDHRLGAWILAIVVPVAWWKVRAAGISPRAGLGATLLLAMLAVQIVLGIATLVNVVPLTLAAAHQAGAVLVFALALATAHATRRAGAELPNRSG